MNNPVVEPRLQEFRARVAPFKGVLDELIVACAATNVQGKWIALFLRLTLKNSNDGTPIQRLLVQPNPTFRAIVVPLKADAFDGYLEQLVSTGAITIAGDDNTCEVFASRAHAGINTGSPASLFFMGPIERTIERFSGQPRSTIEVTTNPNDRMYDLISSNDTRELSNQLRNQDPPINGLRDLMTVLGTDLDPEHATSAQNPVEVVAVLPFHFWEDGGKLLVECPQSAASALKMLNFFAPSGSLVQKPQHSQPLSNGKRARITYEIRWPAESTAVTAILQYAGEKVAELHVRRWSRTANWLVALDSFFDSSQALLAESLTGRQSARDFEHGIVRLLSLLQVPTCWYGDDKKFPNKPDLASGVELDGQWMVLLGECTLQKPSAKFTPLLQRKKEIFETVGPELMVIPTVFTASTVSSADRNQGAQDGIALVGADQLSTLISGLEERWGPKKVFDYLSSLTMIRTDFLTADPWSTS